MTTPFAPYPGSGMNRRDIFKQRCGKVGQLCQCANCPRSRMPAKLLKRFKMKKSINLWAFRIPTG